MSVAEESVIQEQETLKINELQHVKAEAIVIEEIIEDEFEHGEHPSKEFLEIFDKLDLTINGELIEKAWKQYDTIGQQVILEGPKKAWMACAFYTTVWQSTPLGQEPICKYSVSKLLNICHLSVLEFFEKLNKWAEMIVSSRRLLDHINKVQSSLAVSTVVYKKFLSIFRRVFLNSVAPAQRSSPLKSKFVSPLVGITSAQIFELIWVMFIAFKKQFLTTGDDLMNSFHLLLCIVELIFEDLRESKLTHLYNPEFEKALKNDKLEMTALENLCETFEGVILDAKHFRAHWLFPKLRKLADDGLLIGSTNEGGILANIRANKEALDCLYEEGMMKKAEIDERIFTVSATENMDTVFNEALDASAIIMLRRCTLDTNWAIDAELLLRMSTQNCLEKLNNPKSWQTPLSTKSYVITPEQFCPNTPSLSTNSASSKIQKITALLSIDFRHTDNEFDQLLSMCRENPKSFIADQVAILNDRFEQTIERERASKGSTFDSSFSSQTNKLKEDIELLFYRLLQQVVLHERERSFNNGVEIAADLSTILHKVDFIGSLWVTALEIILFCYDSEREFPWSSNVASVAPVNFYKIVELVIRAEPELSREMVKHLNKVEERVLEELAWVVDSPLWGALARYAETGVPSCRAVSLTAVQQNVNRGPSAHYPPVDSYSGSERGFATGTQTDAPTLVSRYSNSPMKAFERIPVKRRLEYDSYGEIVVDESGALSENGEGSIHSAQPRVKRPAPEELVSEFSDYSQQPRSNPNVLPSSLIVFFRKVYYLAAVRLTDLCDRIRIEEVNRQKVWTLFEHALRNETTLMTGRHLDQNLMCCLYIVAKVCSLETSFHDIMYHYRHQPQAVSRVYRHVLIDSSASPATVLLTDDGASRDSVSSASGGKLRSSSALPTPDTASAPPTPEPHNQDYADLIKYYNRVFVARVEEFMKLFNPTNIDSKENVLTLISMPKVYCNSLSPRRLVNEQINVMPMSSYPALPGRPARYNFNRSPSKDLKSINAMVRGAHVMMPHGY